MKTEPIQNSANAPASISAFKRNAADAFTRPGAEIGSDSQMIVLNVEWLKSVLFATTNAGDVTSATMPRPGYKSERLVFLFAVGLIAFNAPILRMFDKVDSVFGIPLLSFYLFLAWACLIALAAFSIDWRDVGDDHDLDDDREGVDDESALPR